MEDGGVGGGGDGGGGALAGLKNDRTFANLVKTAPLA